MKLRQSESNWAYDFMLTWAWKIINSDFKILVTIIGSQSSFWHPQLDPAGVKRSNALTFINQKFIFMSFSEDSIKSVGSSKKPPPLHIRQSRSSKLDGWDILLVLFFFLTPHNDLSCFSISISQVSNQTMLRRSENLSNTGFHLSDKFGRWFIVVNFKDQFLFD